MVSSSATCGALTVVGYLMISDIVNIDWTKLETAFSAFITIIGVPLTYSITYGIGLGFVSYCLIMFARGKGRDVSPLMWIATAAFVVMFIFA